MYSRNRNHNKRVIIGREITVAQYLGVLTSTFDVNGTCFLSPVIESDEKFDLIARSKVTGVTTPCEGVHVEKYTPRTPFILVGYEPILQRAKGGGGKWKE